MQPGLTRLLVVGNSRSLFLSFLLLSTPMPHSRTVLEDLAFTGRVILVGHPGERPWFNVCLLIIPFAVMAEALHWPGSVRFILALLSMLPLAERLGFCTEELSEHVNDTTAGLMNASMGNAPELIIALFALSAGKIDVVKESLIGSVLSNLLLVLGSALLVGGTRVHMQSFNNVLAPQNAIMLLACSLAVFMPTSLVASGLELRPGGALLTSRVSSLFLLLLYCAYLIFQLKTHAELFDDEGEGGGEEGGGEVNEASPLTAAEQLSAGSESSVAGGGSSSSSSRSLPVNSAAALPPSAAAAEAEEAGAAAAFALPIPKGTGMSELLVQPPPPTEHLTLLGSMFGLACMAALVACVSDILVGAIEDAGMSWGISPAFIAAMLVPIAGNAAEHTSALIFAYKDRLDLALGICVGSAVQIYAFVLPLLVVMGWMINKPMSLDFKVFEFGALLFSVLLTNATLQPGRTNYLSGCVHVLSYLMLCVGYLQYSGPCPTGSVVGLGGLTCEVAGNATKLL